MSAQTQDTLWVVGVFLVALACLYYVREGLRTGDALLVVGGLVAAVGFSIAGVLYLWWVA